MVVDVVEVVHDHEQPPAWIAGAEPTEGLEEVRQSLLTAKDAAETVSVDVVEAKELLSTPEPVIGRPTP